MKKTLLLFGVIGLLILTGCVNPPITNPPGNGNNPPGNETSHAWVFYAPVQAETNSWQVSTIPSWSTQTETEQLHGWLEANEITAFQFGFIPHDDVTCAALNCPRGDYALVKAGDAASYSKLIALGFSSFSEVGVLATINEQHTATITVINGTNEPIYYGGCNEYTFQNLSKVGGPNYVSEIIPKTCVWEGTPSTLQGGDDSTFTYTIQHPGLWKVVFAYGTGCEADVPLSQANCSDNDVKHSNILEVILPGKFDYVHMIYSLKQCNTNPWQGGIDANVLSPELDQKAFEKWMKENGLHPTLVSFVPASPNTIVCLACSCPSGDQYQMVIPQKEQTLAEEVGFTFNGGYFPALSPPAYDQARWFVYTPYQCFANKWNSSSDAVHSVEKDFQTMKKWLGENGVDVEYLAFIRGVSLSQQCTKLSTDKYGVGVLDTASADILPTLGFVEAGKSQTELFTDVTDLTPVSLLYKTKFCAGNPWGEPVLEMDNAEMVSLRVSQWLAEQGVEIGKTPSVHTVPVSFSETCDTDSGLGVFITVPKWSEPHLAALGFGKASTQFTLNAEKTQIYPVVNTSIQPAGEVTMVYAFMLCQSPPWVGNLTVVLSPEDHEKKAEIWLNGLGVHPMHVEYVETPDGFSACEACTICPAGPTIQIIVPESEKGMAQENGFVEKES